jgi:hypothetical protein
MTDTRFEAATAILGRPPTPAEQAAIAAQSARLAQLYDSALLPALSPVEGSPGLFYATGHDLVPILPWEGQP